MISTREPPRDRPAPMVVGQCPGREIPISWALFPYPTNSAGYRLWRMCQEAVAPDRFFRADYLRTFRRVNVMNHPVEFAKHRVPRERKAALLRRFASEQVSTVIILGYTVAEKLDLGRPSLCSATSGGAFSFTVIPHPSGRNPWYEYEANRARVVDFLGNVIERYRMPPEDWDPDVVRP